ncbi:hypothetical protein COLO4_27978 [Corchorus olitorius]|uniref:Uncharacterized protein n=1 Tax=Corchorus olitorius TaxID=93759 RepID=A0A1R3HNU4_9ROSI|nr:hypothetical protein COLO4_27978 [Corchorus olitorius]
MDSLSSVSPSIVLPPSNPLPTRHRRQVATFSFAANNRLPRLSSFFSVPSSRGRLSRAVDCKCKLNGRDARSGEDDESDGFDEKEEVERALHLDVLEANPWRDPSKPVYVLTHKENQLCTMKTRRNRSEVERELGLLFSKGAKWSSGISNKTKQPRSGTKFQMVVEDVREGVLVFEDETEAAKYCDLMQGGGQGCEGVAEIEASSVFDLCQKMRALAVLFRRGRTPPLPQSLELNLRARKRSLEDQEDIM